MNLSSRHVNAMNSNYPGCVSAGGCLIMDGGLEPSAPAHQPSQGRDGYRQPEDGRQLVIHTEIYAVRKIFMNADL